MKKTILAILVLFVSVGICFGHACHNPWRPSPSSGGGSSPATPPPPPMPPPPVKKFTEAKLSLSAEKQNIKVSKEGEFRIFVQALSLVPGSSKPVEGINLSSNSDAFDIELSPSSIEKLYVGQRIPVTVKVKLKKESGSYQIKFEAKAKDDSVVTPIASQLTVNAYQYKLNLVSSKDTLQVDKDISEYKFYIQNPGKDDLKAVNLSVKSDVFDIELTPAVKDTLASNGMFSLSVKLTKKKNAVKGEYPLVFKATVDNKESLLSVEEIKTVLK